MPEPRDEIALGGGGAPSDVVAAGMDRLLALNDRSELAQPPEANVRATTPAGRAPIAEEHQAEVEAWSDIRPDARIGNWIVETQIGEGGFGRVWATHHHVEHRLRAAVKVLSDERSDDATVRERFTMEARAAIHLTQEINSQYIARIHDVGKLRDRTPWFAMELLRGESLARRLARGPLEREELHVVAVGVCRGLSAIHEAGYVHRDIKPANIFLCDGTPIRVKILDLGLVKSANALTRPSERIGTLPYTPPEVFERGADVVDARADLHAIGVLLFECITGERAFSGRSEAEVALAVTERQARDLDWCGVPEDVRECLIRAMAKRPEDRQESVEALRIELEPELMRWSQADADPSGVDEQRASEPVVPSDQRTGATANRPFWPGPRLAIIAVGLISALVLLLALRPWE